MQLLKIRDRRDRGLSFDLQHVLSALGMDALDAIWEVDRVDRDDEDLMATGDAADQLFELTQAKRKISGKELARLASGCQQVIWGEFRGYKAETDEEPWVVVRAIDSSWYEVESDDGDVLERIKSTFTDVRS